MVVHLQNFAPHHWRVIGEQTGRHVIRLGIDQAKRYGFTNRGPVRFYIEMMFMFGSYFDTDPQYPWTAEALNDPENTDQMIRADRLYDVMTEYSDVVAGPKNEYKFSALRRLNQARAQDYVSAALPLEDCLVAGLKSIYPEKCAYLGEEPLRVLLKKSLELATKYDLSSSEDTALMAALTFFLGHECTRDPLHGWIGRRLEKERFATAAARGADLRAKALLYLRQTLGNDEALA